MDSGVVEKLLVHRVADVGEASSFGLGEDAGAVGLTRTPQLTDTRPVTSLRID